MHISKFNKIMSIIKNNIRLREIKKKNIFISSGTLGQKTRGSNQYPYDRILLKLISWVNNLIIRVVSFRDLSFQKIANNLNIFQILLGAKHVTGSLNLDFLDLAIFQLYAFVIYYRLIHCIHIRVRDTYI